jgi:mandelamide amidase
MLPGEVSLSKNAERVRTGEVTSVALVEQALETAEKYRESNFFTELDSEAALAQARAIDKNPTTKRTGALTGVPIVVKDNIDTQGMITSAGSSAFAGWRPKTDAPIVAALKAQGAVILGKTNMHELAFGVTSNNAFYGPVRNPYDRTRISGGSSGGTAAAISAGIVAGGLGTDTGGSCRMPASLCGCVGFRPGDGRWSLEGLIPLSWTRDAPGPLAATVDDAALLDAICSRVPANQSAIGALKDLRLGVPRRHFLERLDKDVRAEFDDALSALRKAGVTLVVADFDDIAGELEKTRAIVRFESVKALSGYLAAHGISRSPTDLIASISGTFERNFIASSLTDNKVDATDYLTSLIKHRPALQASYARYFAENKIAGFVVPATIRTAAKIGEDDTVEVDGVSGPTFLTYTHNTGPSSAAGVPCLSLPIGLSGEGLPIGVDVVGPAGRDGDVFAIARLIERALPKIPRPRDPAWANA